VEELQDADAVRWVDLDASGLEAAAAQSLLHPVCGGDLDARMARDLVTARRFPAGRRYRGGRIRMTSAFQIRHVQLGVEAARSLFDPVQLLIAEDWLVSAWLPPRPFRGQEGAVGERASADAGGLYEAVAEAWPASEGETAGDLADLVRRELAIECGYRSRTA
jgi:hypothetical protein